MVLNPLCNLTDALREHSPDHLKKATRLPYACAPRICATTIPWWHGLGLRFDDFHVENVIQHYPNKFFHIPDFSH